MPTLNFQYQGPRRINGGVEVASASRWRIHLIGCATDLSLAGIMAFLQRHVPNARAWHHHVTCLSALRLQNGRNTNTDHATHHVSCSFKDLLVAFLFLVAMPFAPSSVLLFLVVRPGATGSVHAPSSELHMMREHQAVWKYLAIKYPHSRPRKHSEQGLAFQASK